MAEKEKVVLPILYGVATVARLLQISESSVYRMIRKGELKAIRTGPKKGFRVPAPALEEFLKRRNQEAERLAT